ncbi:MAG: M1 family metallopeptidase [Gammaproteobacteria bacterium]
MPIIKACSTAAKPMLVALLSLISSTALSQVHHNLQVTLKPEQHRFTVVSTVTLPHNHAGTVHFRLHAGLKPSVAETGIKLKSRAVRQQQGLLPQPPRVPLEQFSLRLPADRREFTLHYGGEIHHPIAPVTEIYGRGLPTTPGLIAPEGVFLARSSYWYPRFGDELVTFSLQVHSPSGWRSISQGGRIQYREEDGNTREHWRDDSPQQEIYLLAGKLTEYEGSSGKVDTMVFLRRPDPDLATRYLEAAAQYLALYADLIGPYPYPKFALVENFWETGYGMPSFTLLGSRVIRLPFILHSSYPHEILHNWWGNSVYVDYTAGNWAEGLTSYLADHLVQEQRGQAVTYRRDTLQRYTHYVQDARDFPLTAFRARHSAPTEAIGYGKTLMLFHMLRQQLGDANFIQGLRDLYRQHQFQETDFRQVLESFETGSLEPLDGFFEQWVERTGAPSLRVSAARARPEPTHFRLTAELEQVQPAPPYRLRIPIAVHLEGEEYAYQTHIEMEHQRTTLDLRLPTRPVRLDVDPEFDIFRRLARNEIPPALHEAFAAERALAVLPASAPPRLQQEYLKVAQSWPRGKSEHLAITFDHELSQLPSGQTVWLFGWENRFREVLMRALREYAFTDSDHQLTVAGFALSPDEHSVVVVARRSEDPADTVIWVATENVAALPGLAKKLPHYGKYSYLGFTGDEPSNVLKGQWPVVGSSLSVSIDQEDGTSVPAERARLAPRVPLAESEPNAPEARSSFRQGCFSERTLGAAS